MSDRNANGTFAPGNPGGPRRGIMEEVACKKMFPYSRASRATGIPEIVT
jgi:hypothetical protein